MKYNYNLIINLKDIFFLIFNFNYILFNLLIFKIIISNINNLKCQKRMMKKRQYHAK